MQITQTNPLTFEDEVFEIDDFQHKLATEIKQVLDKHIKIPNFSLENYQMIYPVNVTDIIVDDNKLHIGFMQERKLGDTASKYKITIEKMNTNV